MKSRSLLPIMVALGFCFVLIRMTQPAVARGEQRTNFPTLSVVTTPTFSLPTTTPPPPAPLPAAIPEIPAPPTITLAIDTATLAPREDSLAAPTVAFPVLPPLPSLTAPVRSFAPPRLPFDPGKYRIITALVTAYCPCTRCCGRQARGRTSLGTTAWIPGIASAPQAVPYGTYVGVPGYGIFAIDDTGAAMRRSWERGTIQLDVRMNTHAEARAWGRKVLKVRVYK